MKTKTLFAYLLQQGGKGAPAEDLADLLWPAAESADAARNRLYHTVRYLRRARTTSGAMGLIMCWFRLIAVGSTFRPSNSSAAKAKAT